MSFTFVYAVRIESFCINVNILYASTVDTVAFMKVTSFSLVWGLQNIS